jgi:hypothetical protein
VSLFLVGHIYRCNIGGLAVADGIACFLMAGRERRLADEN